MITAERLLRIHDEIIGRHGGIAGVRDQGTVDHVAWVAEELADAGKPVEAAAVLIEGIANWHPFNDGNKRTAFEAADTLLRMNGMRIEAPTPETISMLLAVSQGLMDRDGIETWLLSRLTFG